jgi:hypothetical protein
MNADGCLKGLDPALRRLLRDSKNPGFDHNMPGTTYSANPTYDKNSEFRHGL